MATKEHQQLSSFIKNVHQTLRFRAQKIGAEEAWSEHCSNVTTLQEYSIAMKRLASKFWKENVEDKKKRLKEREMFQVNGGNR